MYRREQIHRTKCQCGRGRGKSAETVTNITNEELRPSILSGRCATTGGRAGHCHLDNLLYFAIRGDPPWGGRPVSILLISNVVIHDLIRSFRLW
jgi:hypothetical protein